MKLSKLCVCLAWMAIALGGPTARGADLSADQIIEKAEFQLWGKTMRGDFEMTVTTPTWERTLTLSAWMDRPNLSFLRIHTPEKERGISSLRVKSDMWNYIPKIERTVKVPPSLMLQPWFGSDFTNDDLVKEGSFVADYTHRLVDQRDVNGQPAYVVELLPKPDAVVVWGKVIYSARKSDLVPLQVEYYEERGKLARVLEYRDIRAAGGHVIPTTWEMRPVEKPGKKTTIVVKRVEYDKPVDSEIFTHRNLSRKDSNS